MCRRLPADVLERILLRLSPKSLVACKRVCKSWYALITDPVFVNNHLRISVDSSKHSPSVSLFLTWTQCVPSPWGRTRSGKKGPATRKLATSLIRIDDDDDRYLLPCEIVEDVSLPEVPNMRGQVAPERLYSCHCDGVVCLFDWVKPTLLEIVLCNIELKECKVFRAPSFTLTPVLRVATCAFGYDSRAGVYKYVQPFHNVADASLSRAAVYTLGTDAWKEIRINLVDKSASICDEGVYGNGVHHWLCLGSKYSVLAFDMSKEVSDNILLPDDIATAMKISLALWKERVVFFCLDESDRFSISFEMWVMVKNSGAVEGFSWAKHAHIMPPFYLDIHSPITFWKGDELLMDTEHGKFVSYNISTKNSRQLVISGVPVKGTSRAHIYSPSLVSVKTRNAINR